MTKALKEGEPAEATFEIETTLKITIKVTAHHNETITWKTVCDAVNEELGISSKHYPNAYVLMTKAVVRNVEMGRAPNRPSDPLYVEIDLAKLYATKMYEMDGEDLDTILDGDDSD